MIQIGNMNRLMVLEYQDGKFYLGAGRDNLVVLPEHEAPANCQVGDMIDVFIYPESGSERLTAALKKPLAMVGQFAYLKVSSLQKVGAFLDWGLPKELFLPFREQTRDLRIGDSVTVFLYLDSSSRISASMRIEKHLEKYPTHFREGDRVELMIFTRTDLGFKAIVNGRHLGILYQNEIFQPVKFGTPVIGFIRKIREDGKIDLSLQQAGYRACGDISKKILATLSMSGDFLSVTDKSSAEDIYDLFGVSKKKYKMAVGALYKKGQIQIEENGIRLVPAQTRYTPPVKHLIS